MNALTHFDFKSSSVRIVLDDNGEPLFCLADVYKALDISRTSRLFRELDPKGVADCHIPTNGGNQKLIFISEPNLYRVIFRSNKRWRSRIWREYGWSQPSAITKPGIGGLLIIR